MKIGIIMGGNSSEREVSLNSGNNIYEALTKLNKYDLKKISFKDPIELDNLITDIDFAFIALHGAFGEDGKIQAILEGKNIPYSGSGVVSSAICMDKNYTKTILAYNKITTPKWLTIRKGEPADFNKIKTLGGKKWIAKPNSGGSSVATAFFAQKNNFKNALDKIFEIDNEAIIEEAIIGKEYTVPILGDKTLPILRIIPKTSSFFDYKAKYSDNATEEKLADDLSKETEAQINDMAQKAFYLLKNKVYARIDFLVQDNIPYLLEINTLPGMTKASLFPKSAKLAGIEFEELLDKIIELSLTKDF